MMRKSTSSIIEDLDSILIADTKRTDIKSLLATEMSFKEAENIIAGMVARKDTESLLAAGFSEKEVEALLAKTQKVGNITVSTNPFKSRKLYYRELLENSDASQAKDWMYNFSMAMIKERAEDNDEEYKTKHKFKYFVDRVKGRNTESYDEKSYNIKVALNVGNKPYNFVIDNLPSEDDLMAIWYALKSYGADMKTSSFEDSIRTYLFFWGSFVHNQRLKVTVDKLSCIGGEVNKGDVLVFDSYENAKPGFESNPLSHKVIALFKTKKGEIRIPFGQSISTFLEVVEAEEPGIEYPQREKARKVLSSMISSVIFAADIKKVQKFDSEHAIAGERKWSECFEWIEEESIHLHENNAVIDYNAYNKEKHNKFLREAAIEKQKRLEKKQDMIDQNRMILELQKKGVDRKYIHQLKKVRHLPKQQFMKTYNDVMKEIDKNANYKITDRR